MTLGDGVTVYHGKEKFKNEISDTKAEELGLGSDSSTETDSESDSEE
ncbi:MAG: hypothetical protein PQJ46_09405 [Spirochaetales bacterium]|nr:hypothetical protein [Spirochaetales bacterium]